MTARNRIWTALFAFTVLPATALSSQMVAAPPDAAAREADLAELAAAIAADPELANAMSTSHEGLYEEEMPGGGGFKLDLQGRFHQFVFARLGPDGRVTTSHSLPLPLFLEPTGAAAVCRPVEIGSNELPGGRHASR